jgi:glycosyltransferase involved in cell wall biosynthesis
VKITIVIPVYNERAALPLAIREICQVTAGLEESVEILVVDDGSTDGLREDFPSIQASVPLTLLTLSRNFGKESALYAGLAYAEGDAVITMDADLQHPPSLLPTFVAKWKEGAKIVNGVHMQRTHQGLLHRLSTALFYRIFHSLAGLKLEEQSDFKLLDKSVVRELRAMPERNRFYRGLTAWIGMNSTEVRFEAGERCAGVTKWSWLSLFRYAGRNLVAFSDLPLIAVALLGVAMLVFCAVLGAQTLYNYLSGRALDGFTTVILLQVILSSVIVLSLGVIAIYLGQILREVKRRPNAVVAQVWPEKPSKSENEREPDL